MHAFCMLHQMVTQRSITVWHRNAASWNGTTYQWHRVIHCTASQMAPHHQTVPYYASYPVAPPGCITKRRCITKMTLHDQIVPHHLHHRSIGWHHQNGAAWHNNTYSAAPLMAALSLLDAAISTDCDCSRLYKCNIQNTIWKWPTSCAGYCRSKGLKIIYFKKAIKDNYTKKVILAHNLNLGFFSTS